MKRENLLRVLALFGIYSDIILMLFFTVFSFFFAGGETRMQRDVSYLKLIMGVGVAWILGVPLFLIAGRSLKRRARASEQGDTELFELRSFLFCTWVIYCVAALISMSILSLNITLGK